MATVWNQQHKKIELLRQLIMTPPREVYTVSEEVHKHQSLHEEYNILYWCFSVYA